MSSWSKLLVFSDTAQSFEKNLEKKNLINFDDKSAWLKYFLIKDKLSA